MPRLHNSRVTALVEIADGGVERGVDIFGGEPRTGAQTGVAVKPGGCRGGFERSQALSQEPADQAGENIARAGGGEEGAGVGVDDGAAIRGGDDGVGAFEKNDSVDLRGGGADGFDAIGGAGEQVREEAFELAGVRSDDGGGC